MSKTKGLSTNKILFGALAGLAATVPMTLAMRAMHKQLPREERYPLPPRLITRQVIEAVGVDDEFNDRQEMNFFTP